MTEQECRNKVRCTLSDRTGLLRFESFDIVDAPERGEMAAMLRHYLVGRALAETDAGYIRELGRMTHPLCAQVIAQLVEESQETFIHRRQFQTGDPAHRSGAGAESASSRPLKPEQRKADEKAASDRPLRRKG